MEYLNLFEALLDSSSDSSSEEEDVIEVKQPKWAFDEGNNSRRLDFLERVSQQS